jgi:hypothetical protein
MPANYQARERGGLDVEPLARPAGFSLSHAQLFVRGVTT